GVRADFFFLLLCVGTFVFALTSFYAVATCYMALLGSNSKLLVRLAQTVSCRASARAYAAGCANFFPRSSARFCSLVLAIADLAMRECGFTRRRPFSS